MDHQQQPTLPSLPLVPLPRYVSPSPYRIPNRSLTQVQVQLWYLLHAVTCPTPPQPVPYGTGRVHQCSFNCSVMKLTLKHILDSGTHRSVGDTTYPTNCHIPHCNISRNILGHWYHCRVGNCATCTKLMIEFPHMKIPAYLAQYRGKLPNVGRFQLHPQSSIHMTYF